MGTVNHALLPSGVPDLKLICTLCVGTDWHVQQVLLPHVRANNGIIINVESFALKRAEGIESLTNADPALAAN